MTDKNDIDPFDPFDCTISFADQNMRNCEIREEMARDAIKVRRNDDGSWTRIGEGNNGWRFYTGEDAKILDKPSGS